MTFRDGESVGTQQRAGSLCAAIGMGHRLARNRGLA